MSATKAKYVSVWSKEAALLALKMSSLAADGYTVVQTMLQPAFAYPDGSTGGGDFYAIMKLREEVSFRGVEELVNVDITSDGREIREKLSQGWEIIANYAKTITMVKRKVGLPVASNEARVPERVLISPELRAQREASS